MKTGRKKSAKEKLFFGIATLGLIAGVIFFLSNRFQSFMGYHFWGSPKISPRQTFAHLTPLPTVSPTPTSTPTPTPTPKPLVPDLVPGERGMKVPVLLYHYISANSNAADVMRNGLSTPPDILDTQLQTLKSHGFTTITFDELAAAFAGKTTLPSKPIILTFDDGYIDFYYNAHPLLIKYQMKGVAFIPTGLIGGGSYMTWGQIEELAKSPYVVFGAHSIHHYYLPKSLPQVLHAEVAESKHVLEQHVGYVVNWFAYPYGAFNDAVISEVKQAGFIGATTTIPGAWQYQSRFFYIPRYRAGTRVGESLLKLVN